MTEAYILPPTMGCLHPSNAYVIRSSMTLLTDSGAPTIVPLAVQLIGDSLRDAAPIDGIVPSVVIQGPCGSDFRYFIAIMYPRAVITYSELVPDEIIPVFVPICPQGDKTATYLTQQFKGEGPLYTGMLDLLNANLQMPVASVTFADFTFDGLYFAKDDPACFLTTTARPAFRK